MNTTAALNLFHIDEDYDREGLEAIYTFEKTIASSHIDKGETQEEQQLWNSKLNQLESAYTTLVAQLPKDSSQTLRQQRIEVRRPAFLLEPQERIPHTVVAVTALSAVLFVIAAYWGVYKKVDPSLMLEPAQYSAPHYQNSVRHYPR